QSQLDQLAIRFAVLADGSRWVGGPWLPEDDPPESVVTSMAGFAQSKSVVTFMAGFAGARRPHPGRHTTTPAAFREALAVSLRTPVACSMGRKCPPSL